MNSTRFWVLSLSGAIGLISVTLSGLPTLSNPLSVEQRQAKMMQDVNAGQKSGALTAKESKKLRKNLADVARKKAAMKSNANGKLSVADTATMQKIIDRTSNKITLEKGEQPL